MKTLLKAIDEMRQDVKELRADMNKGKGVVSLLVFMGGLVLLPSLVTLNGMVRTRKTASIKSDGI
jgi:hypothetical protein